MGRISAILVCAFVLGAPAYPDEPNRKSQEALSDLGRRAFRWFEDNRNPRSGLVRDRAPNWKGHGSLSNMASIASSGYYLSMLPEAVRLSEISGAEAEARALQMLRFVSEKMQHQNGLLFHFIDWETGTRLGNCEISVLDSSIFFNGCMVAGQAFGGKVAEQADALLDRVNWTKFLTVLPRNGRSVLSFGWKPESGLLGPIDVRSSELSMPYFLAVGSRTHPIDPACWYNMPIHFGIVGGYRILNPGHPLFTSYYGLGWHNLKGKHDRSGLDLDANARLAALANRAFCGQMSSQYRTYRKSEGGWWGISAGDGPRGYIAPGPVPKEIDGTVWPTAALAAITWIPNEVEADVVSWKASPNWKRSLGDYGLAPFNLDKDWTGADVIGIDLGSFHINLANQRHHTVWDLWMQHPVAKRGVERLGFVSSP
jgi:hypothetical protein